MKQSQSILENLSAVVKQGRLVQNFRVPRKWVPPVVRSALLPLHANGSPV